MLEKGSRFEGRYEIEGPLGSGSFSRVYRARQLSTGQTVAIKLLHLRDGGGSSSGSEAQRFRRETQICAALSHTNIVRLMDSGQTAAGQLYAVFEYVPGETLEQALEREGRLAVREALRLMTQVLDALSAAHAKGIVHRDLKPSNLVLSGTGARRNALVLDFGVGGLVEGRRRKEWQTLTQGQQFLGTPLYAAPEQLGGGPPTERSDLYAWGLVFLECLTGHPPFEAEGAAARLMTGGGTVEIPAWLRGHRLGALLERVTAREAEERSLSVEALIETLDEIASEELPVAPEEVPTPAPLSDRGERRHLTVMFCDLFGSTALSQQLDAEKYREIVRAYQARGAEAVERYEGHVVQYLGDGLLVYFGYPQSHEDDAERAIRAGREVLRGLEVLSARTESEYGVPISARVGIHTGPVVVGEMGGGEKKEVLALGDTPNIAARLQGFAEPGTVVVSEATARLVPGIFVTRDRGTPALKDLSEPIRAYEVLLPSGIRGRLERATGLSPFVGREDELGLLVRRFEHADEGEGQAVLVAGEAGIGKSRLVRELRRRLRERPHSWLECQASPYTRGSALQPLIAMLEEALDFRGGDSSEERTARIERGLAQAGLERDEAVPLIASLLSVRLPERYAPLEISPALQRQKTLETLLAWVLALADEQPVVLLVEDLHWIDPSTLEWLGMLIEQCPTANVLLLMTHRPEFTPSWPPREHMHSLMLGRLSRRQSRDLVARATADEDLSAELVQRIATRSDGVPLFAEELAKGVVEAGSSDALDIPETLHDSLMGRLDRLGEVKMVAQVAAAIGREFEYGLLEAVVPATKSALREGLARLVAAELVYQRGLPPKAAYTFKHALVQDTAYQSLLESQRRELHGRIADALEKRFPERVEREPETIARHCEAAGRTQQAVDHYQRAGERAALRWEREEATGHLRHGIALLERLPPTSERGQQELALQLALGSCLIAAPRGYGDIEHARAFERARALCEEVGESPELLRALIGLSEFYFIRGELQASHDHALRALRIADEIGEAYPRIVAHARLGIALLLRGETRRAREHLERAARLYDPAEHRPLAPFWGQDWGILARSFLSSACLKLGYPDQARSAQRETVAMAREGDPFSLTIALIHQAGVDPANAVECLDEAIALSMERGYKALVLATISRGLLRGDSRGLQEAERAAPELASSELAVFRQSGQLQLARAYQQLGRSEDAWAMLDAALAPAGETRLNDADLFRLRGEICMRRDASSGEAERCLRRAMEIAREQEARWDELQAARSLARLLREEGRRSEAREVLAPAYAWFTEGFETANLKDARTLLDEL